MAKQGLRVLYFATKQLELQDNYEEDELTCGYTLLGVTAVEDLLQEEV